jgi:hypothetical protein
MGGRDDKEEAERAAETHRKGTKRTGVAAATRGCLQLYSRREISCMIMHDYLSEPSTHPTKARSVDLNRMAERRTSQPA